MDPIADNKDSTGDEMKVAWKSVLGMAKDEIVKSLAGKTGIAYGPYAPKYLTIVRSQLFDQHGLDAALRKSFA